MARPARDAGESLIEILMAVTIMAIAFGGILAGLGTAIRGSTVHAAQSDVQESARDVAEQLKQQAFIACAVGADPAYAFTPATGTTASLTFDYWNGTGWSATCLPTTKLQRVTVTAKATNGRAADEVLQLTMRAA